jgi:hypothetical protein
MPTLMIHAYMHTCIHMLQNVVCGNTWAMAGDPAYMCLGNTYVYIEVQCMRGVCAIRDFTTQARKISGSATLIMAIIVDAVFPFKAGNV